MKYSLKSFAVISLFSALTSEALSQEYNNNWAFGDGLLLTFEDALPTLSTSKLFSFEGAASVSDMDGNLLFYTNGRTVWKSDGTVMLNGHDLMGNAITSSTQGVVIAPSGIDRNRYYIFSLDEKENEGINNLYYSIVDLSLNNREGAVINEYKNIVLDTDVSEKMTLVPGDNCYIWLLVHHKDRPEFRAYKIDTKGLNDIPVISTTGYGSGRNCYMEGEMKVSPDHTMIATSSRNPRLLELYQFDNTSGIVSNARSLSRTDSGNIVYGLSFSPDSKKLFAGNIEENGLYQYNLEQYPDTAAIILSQKKISDNSIRGMRSSPDGKHIYVINNGNIGRINHPDLEGPACNFEEDIGIAVGSNCSGLGSLFVPLYIPQTSGQQTHWICPGSNLHLTASMGSAYLWSTGSTDSGIIVREPASYWVTIYNDGCTITDTIKVQSSSCTECLLLPNAFTPNGDGINDQFNIMSPCSIQTFILKIYNRWGQQVFISYSMNEAWNGMFNSVLCDAGVYFYDIYAITNDNKTLRKKGDISLIR